MVTILASFSLYSEKARISNNEGWNHLFTTGIDCQLHVSLGIKRQFVSHKKAFSSSC